MATFRINFPEKMAEQLLYLENNYPNIVKNMLVAGAAVLEPEIRMRMDSAIGYELKGESKSTGELINSLKSAKPKKYKRGGGYYLKVAFKKKDSKGEYNALKAIRKEYGTSKQKAVPVVRPALIAKENEIHNAMKKVFEEEFFKK